MPMAGGAAARSGPARAVSEGGNRLPYPRALAGEDELRRFPTAEQPSRGRKRPAPRSSHPNRLPLWMRPPPFSRERVGQEMEYMEPWELEREAVPRSTSACVRRPARNTQTAWQQLGAMEAAAGDARTSQRLRERLRVLEQETARATAEMRRRTQTERQRNERILAAASKRTPPPDEAAIKAWMWREELRFKELEHLAELRLAKAVKEAEAEETEAEMSRLPVGSAMRPLKAPSSAPAGGSRRCPKMKVSSVISASNIAAAIRTRSSSTRMAATESPIKSPFCYPPPTHSYTNK